MEETHITLFNIANPSQGKGKVGAGGANVRGKTEDDEDSNVERNAGVGGGAAAGTAFLRAAAAAAAAAAGETAGASQSVGRPIGGGSGQQVGEYKPQGQRGMSKAEQATNQDILNSAAVIAGAKPMAWAALTIWRTLATPRAWPTVRGIKRFLAQRPLPSMMTAICCGCVFIFS